MAEVEKSLRYRVNIDISAKGIKKWECTVDGTGYEMEEVLAKSADIVAQLEKLYPIKLEEVPVIK